MPRASVQNPTRGQIVQVPDARNGWHTANLREAFKGPGQLLGPIDLDTHGYSDVWSNNISDVAIRARQQEDAAEAAAWQATKVAKGWTNGLPPDASAIDASDFAIGTRREAARDARVYAGSLSKRGEGTLFLDRRQHLARQEHGRAPASSRSSARTRARSTSPAGRSAAAAHVGGSIDVAGGVLQPGLAPERPRITDVPPPGNVLNAGGNVRLGTAGRLGADRDATATTTRSSAPTATWCWAGNSSWTSRNPVPGRGADDRDRPVGHGHVRRPAAGRILPVGGTRSWSSTRPTA